MRRRYGNTSRAYARCHPSRPQVAQTHTSDTWCRLCTRHRQDWWVRLYERIAELERHAEHCEKHGDVGDGEATARQYRRLMRLAWRTTRAYTVEGMHAADARYKRTGPAGFASASCEFPTRGATCCVCAAPAVRNAFTLKYLKVGSWVACDAHGALVKAMAAAQIRAKFPQVTFRFEWERGKA